jgi:hypothetical protein
LSEEIGAYLVAPTELEALTSSTAGGARTLIIWETVAVIELVEE